MAGLNWKNYRSLQKSKLSIKTIEETIKSSRSIEQWLNDFSKLKALNEVSSDSENNDGSKLPVISKRKLVRLVRVCFFVFEIFSPFFLLFDKNRRHFLFV